MTLQGCGRYSHVWESQFRVQEVYYYGFLTACKWRIYRCSSYP